MIQSIHPIHPQKKQTGNNEDHQDENLVNVSETHGEKTDERKRKTKKKCGLDSRTDVGVAKSTLNKVLGEWQRERERERERQTQRRERERDRES